MSIRFLKSEGRFRRLFFIALSLVMTMALISGCAADNGAAPKDDPVKEIQNESSEPYMDDGTYMNHGGMDYTRKLNSENGRYVSLYVENRGEDPIVASINDKEQKTLEQGESCHICVEVATDSSDKEKDYNFKVKSGLDEDFLKEYLANFNRESDAYPVNFYYEIVQSDEVALKDNSVKESRKESSEPYMDGGTYHNDTGLDYTRKLNSENGRYVSLYVENRGSNSVVASINGEDVKTIEQGKNDRVCVEVATDSSDKEKDYNFRVVTGLTGGSVDIYYEIVQSDEAVDEVV